MAIEKMKAAFNLEAAEKINEIIDKLNNLILETNNLADGSVTEKKLADLAVSAAKLASAAVETSKIKDKAVNTNKLADAAVETSKIKDKAVNTNKLADAAVTGEKVKDLSLGPKKLILGFDPLAQEIGAGTITDYATMTDCESKAGGVPNIYYTNAFGTGTGAGGSVERIDFILDSEAHQPGAVVYVLNTGIYSGSALDVSITIKSAGGVTLCEILAGAGKLFFYSGKDSNGVPVWYPV